MKGIKFVYFDVGGVVIRDFSVTRHWNNLKTELGIPAERFSDFEKLWQQYKREICVSRDVDSLLPIISRQFGVKITSGYSLLRNGFVSRFAANPSIYRALRLARKKYRIGLLTDMYKGMLAEIRKRQLLPDISWDVIVDSSVVGYKKPDPKIYQIAEKMADVSGQEILFVENTPKYVAAAREAGWQAYWYDSSDYNRSSQELYKLLS